MVDNAVDKIIAGITLYCSGLSYSSSFFLTVIAEEELAKLYLLPILDEFGGLEEALSNKRSAFYDHRVKQRIFSSYVYFKRKPDEIEDIKQSALYVGLNKKGQIDFCRIKPEVCFNEIKNAVWLFQYQMKHIAEEKTLSKKLVKACLFLNNILADCIKEKVPDLVEVMELDIISAKKAINKSKNSKEISFYEALFKNPYEQIRILKYSLGEDRYKEFLKKTHKLSFEDLVGRLGKEMEIEND